MDVDIKGRTGFLGQALGARFAAIEPDGQRRLVICASVQPARQSPEEAFETNLNIVRTVLAELKHNVPDHITYISSDAVYPFVEEPIDEQAELSPATTYGRMHLEREKILSEEVSEKLLIVRPTMIVGSHDPHKAYGLNRLCRDAMSHGRVSLFGQGEEQRDYIWIDDAATAIVELARTQCIGTYNLASGSSISFMEAARHIREKRGALEIACMERRQPISHRSFDIGKLEQTLPLFRPVDPREQIDRLLSVS